MLPEAIRLAAMGYHFEKVTRQQLELHDFKKFLSAELATLEAEVDRRGADTTIIGDGRSALFTRVDARYASIPEEFRYPGDGIETALESFRSDVNAQADRSGRLSGT